MPSLRAIFGATALSRHLRRVVGGRFALLSARRRGAFARSLDLRPHPPLVAHANARGRIALHRMVRRRSPRKLASFAPLFLNTCGGCGESPLLCPKTWLFFRKHGYFLLKLRGFFVRHLCFRPKEQLIFYPRAPVCSASLRRCFRLSFVSQRHLRYYLFLLASFPPP